MNTKDIVTGILIGAAAGAIAGILFAPAKGSDTRQKIADKSCDFADAVKSKASDIAGGIKDGYESVKSQASNMFAKGKRVAEGAANGIEYDV